MPDSVIEIQHGKKTKRIILSARDKDGKVIEVKWKVVDENKIKVWIKGDNKKPADEEQNTEANLALENVDSRDTSLGAAFLVMAIVGGAIMPPLQGLIIDQKVIFGHPAVNVSFVLPLVCFILIMIYGLRSHRLGQVKGGKA